MKTQNLIRCSLAILATVLLTPLASAQYYQAPTVQGHVEYQTYSSNPQGYSTQQYGAQYQQQYGGQPQFNTYQSQQTYPAQTYPAQNVPTQSYSTQPQTTQHQTNRPTYVAPIHQGNNTHYHDGVRYDSNAGAGLDVRKGFTVGGNYHGEEKFLGVKGNVGAGLYADAGVSQSGNIGNTQITNYANGTGFVGTEAGAQAGLSEKGLGVGANAFAGGRVSGTVGTEVGAFGYGATGEAWSGAGVEAGINTGYHDGKLRFGGELGVAVGVGGKLGVQGEIDVRQIGQDVHGVAQDVGQWGQQAGQNVGQWGQQAGRDVKNWTHNTGNDVKRTTQKVTRSIGNSAKKASNGFKKATKDAFGFLKGKK